LDDALTGSTGSISTMVESSPLDDEIEIISLLIFTEVGNK
jgi:hypothetical protein